MSNGGNDVEMGYYGKCLMTLNWGVWVSIAYFWHGLPPFYRCAQLLVCIGNV